MVCVKVDHTSQWRKFKDVGTVVPQPHFRIARDVVPTCPACVLVDA